MAKLYGTITSDRSSTSRTSSQGIVTTAETWKAKVWVHLSKDGSCAVTVTTKEGGNRQTLWEGNANEKAAEKSA